eukprot:scaffold766_cov210-Alexandrium_tamarense.AAC.38
MFSQVYMQLLSIITLSTLFGAKPTNDKIVLTWRLDYERKISVRVGQRARLNPPPILTETKSRYPFMFTTNLSSSELCYLEIKISPFDHDLLQNKFVGLER